jgi:hypothetical protein
MTATVGGIIFGVVISLIILCIGIFVGVYCVSEEQWVGLISTIILGIGLIIGTWVGVNWYYTGTEAGKRAIKTQDSNFHSGIEREVIVYDMDGDELERYSGKFDVEYTDGRVLFDDENGNRHIIYFKSGTVIINELGETE